MNRFSKPRLRIVIIWLSLLAAAGSVCAAQPLATTIIHGSSAYSAAELFDVYKQYLGQTISQQTASSIAEGIRQKYLGDGYSRPGYKIEDGGLQSGIVRIRIVEPSITAVRLKGNAGPYDARLDSLFGSLSSSQVLRPGEIRNALRRARRLPGLDVNISTTPDAARSGAFVLEVESDYRRVQGNMSLSNRGTEQIGRNLASARIVANSLFGGENSAGVFVTTAESSTSYKSGGLYLHTTLGSRGTTARFQGSATSLKIDFGSALVDQNRDRFLVKVSHPVADSGDRNLTIRGSFDVDNLDLLQDGEVSREDRLHSLGSGLTINWRNGTTQQLLSIDVELGLNAFGGRVDTFTGTDDLRDNDFAIERLHFVLLSRLNERWTIRLDGHAQHSSDILPSIKRFKLGGGRIGRGFEAAAVRGDRGIAGKIELKRSSVRELSLLGRAAIYGFYDIGTAWRNDDAGGESAASAGIGGSIRGDRLSGYLEVAKPLTHADVDGRKDASVFAEIAVRF